MKTLIIGGVAGGASCAARLRRLSEDSEIIIFEKGEYISFANCGLPYYIGKIIQKKSLLTLQTPQSFKNRFNIDVRTKNEVVAIDSDAKTITIKNLIYDEEYIENYDNLVISVGAKPFIPPVDGINSKNVFTLRNIPDMEKIISFIENNQPKSALIVGGGYIGVELAENLKKLNLKISIAEMADHVIASIDKDVACEVHQYLSDNGINLLLNNAVKKIDGNRITLENGYINADMVIMAVGVTPDTEFLKQSNIKLNERGSIIVNENQLTNIPNVYAVGDACEIKNLVTQSSDFIPLAGPANRQGRIAADNICNINSKYESTQGTSILKVFDMSVATTGITESKAKKMNLDYNKTFIYSASHASYYPDFSNMSIKAIWDKKTLKILGAQIVGYDGVDKRIDVIATALRFGAKITDLAKLELSYSPPFGSAKDPVNMLGFVAENVENEKISQFFCDEVDLIPHDNSTFLLDVRTPIEVSRGKIDGFVNIPLDFLRENLDKIPKDKKIYVHCHSGLRSYIACRLLSQKGYNCTNLAGGYRLYSLFTSDIKPHEYICTEK